MWYVKKKNYKKSPGIDPSYNDKTSPPSKWVSISCATNLSSSLQNASMSTYSLMVEVEAEDKNCLPLTSVPEYTYEFD
jgi:hypothetical protein